MRKLISIALFSFLAFSLFAQPDTTKVEAGKKNIVTVIEDGKTTHVKAGGDGGVEVIANEQGDTVHIRIGRRKIEIIETGDGTSVKMDKDKSIKLTDNSFNPHWTGVEMGINLFRQSDYSTYAGSEFPDNFMDLNHGKSISVNLNVFEWAFKNRAQNFGVITGLGFSFMDFAFDQPVTIEKENGNGKIIPVTLESDGLKKSKLNTSYLTAPLMLEVKTPLKAGNSHLCLAAGVIGGLNIGSHTKYKYRNQKEKLRSNFNLNQFKYDLTGRIGLGDFMLFVNWGMTPLFKDKNGPGLVPVTFGFSFPNI